MKQGIIKQYIGSNKVFIETGTYQGKTVDALKNDFEEIHSIELDTDLYRKALVRFKHYQHIHIYNGDSSDILPEILGERDESCLFWLDGHYSGGNTAKGSLNTPIRKELDVILKHRSDHTILIDDARHFTGENDYPTIAEIKDIASEKTITVKNDIIRII